MDKIYTTLNADTLKKAYSLMCLASAMNRLYNENRQQIAYPFSTSRGHEAIQIAAAMHLKPHDFLCPYYRDEAMLLTIGVSPYELMLQLLSRKEDPFSGGRMPYLHPVLQRDDAPQIPFPGSPNGSHVIPATGLAQGLMYLLSQNLRVDYDRPVVLCSLGDSMAVGGEIAEAFQIAVLKSLPVVYLVQDNDWSASVQSAEIRAVDAYELAGGFKGMKRVRINGADFVEAYDKVQIAVEYARQERMPVVLHAKCPLLGDHSSKVRREMYRTDDNIALHQRDEPMERLRRYLLMEGENPQVAAELEQEAKETVARDFALALQAAEPDASGIMLYRSAPAKITEEQGSRNENEAGAPTITLREAAIRATDEILAQHSGAIYYGEEIGGPLGGTHGVALGLAGLHSPDRILNMPATNAYLIGAVAGLAAAGCQPMVSLPSVQAVLAGLNQLRELSRYYYLSNGKSAVPAVIRVSVGNLGAETMLLQLPGIKVMYPSNAADMKGLLKSAFADPGPVIMLEDVELYDLAEAESPEPDIDYVLPLGKARIVQDASSERRDEGNSLLVITYGRGVHWATAASENFPGSVEILDLRTLNPLDWEAIVQAVKRHGKALVLTAESQRNSFAEVLAGRIMQQCFRFLDAPVAVLGSASLPALPANQALANTALPNAEKVAEAIRQLLAN